MNSYEAKQEARRQRLEERAERLQKEAVDTHKHARDMASVIPFGQPILVGHHSERRDRNYRDRIHNTFGRAFELQAKAERTAERAASVGTGGISSDDPDAIVKLRAKLDRRKARQERMKAINAAWRKAGRPKPDNLAGWHKMAEILGRDPADMLRLAADMARSVALRPYIDGRPFEHFEISNNGANIKRIEQRIRRLEALHAAAEECPESETTVNGVRIVENAAENRLQLFFPGKPSAEIRAELKGRGFRWARSVGAWQRHLSHGARHAAECVVKMCRDHQ